MTCRRHTDNMQTTCRQHADDTRVRLRWRFGLVDDICHPHVVHTSSPGRYFICMLSAHAHIIQTSSASRLHYSSWSAWAWTIFYCDRNFFIWWNLWQECWIVSFQDHVNDLWDNLCWWFSLHVASGHCSHLICICTYHLHIIWAYAYYAHIICRGPSYVLSQQTILMWSICHLYYSL